MRKVAKALRRAEELGNMSVWGYRAQITYQHIKAFAAEVRGELSVLLRPVVSRTLSAEVVEDMCSLLRGEYHRLRTAAERGRIQSWKARLQSSFRQSFKWVRDEGKQGSMLMHKTDGSYTVDRNEQLDEMLREWKPIFDKFRHQPAHDQRFVDHFGPYMRSSKMTLEPLTGIFLATVARETAASAPGLDMWRPEALSALGHWFPGLFDDLAAILEYVELTGRWPTPMFSAYTSLIPKDETLFDPRATDFRPITVLSGIYRLWSKARFISALQWQEAWVGKEVYGCRKTRNSEQLAIRIAMDLEASAYGGSEFVGGVSYDFRKAFDLVPINIMLRVLRERGADERMVRPLESMYESLHRVFRLRGALGDWWRSYGGIIQGDALSMVALNSIVSCILEVSEATARASTKARSYADDISAVVAGDSKAEVANGLRHFHGIVTGYVRAGCGEIHLRKCFTFGDEVVRGILDAEIDHFTVGMILGRCALQGYFASGQCRDTTPWAPQEYCGAGHYRGYSVVAHCRDTWWLGIAEIFCSCALQGHVAIERFGPFRIVRLSRAYMIALPALRTH